MITRDGHPTQRTLPPESAAASAGIRVFVSSTHLDNIDRRRLVEDAILRAGMVPVGMERFAAVTEPAVVECERLARECDLYVAVIAHRYGSIPDGRDLSFTELEYEAAKEAGRDRLMFLIDPALPLLPERDYDPGDADDGYAKQAKLHAFRKKCRREGTPALFQEDTLMGVVLHSLHRWQRERDGVASDGSTPRDTARGERHGEWPEAPEIARYRTALEGEHKTLALAGFKTKIRVPIRLEDLYVPLHAVVDLRDSGDAEFADSADAEQRLHEARGRGVREIPLTDAFSEALKRGRRGLMILGDPGSGKTTHLRRLILWCVRQGAESLGLPGDMLPVFLPLRELRDLPGGFAAFVARQIDGTLHPAIAGLGTSLIERGRLLLLIDGLDEVADEKARAEVAAAIEEATRAWPSCIPVVTCRFAGYGGTTRLGPEFLELHLRPLTAAQATAFVRNWYGIVEQALGDDPERAGATAETRAQDLMERLQRADDRSARLAEMTRNPLLLANLCLVHRDRGALPKGRSRLYDDCIDVLLELWREPAGIGVGLPADQARRALQPAALWLHREEQRTRASASELAPEIEPALSAVQWKGGDAAEFLRAVRDRSGLLTGWGRDHFGFMHLGFQEYLAAREIRRRALEGEPEILAELAGRFGQSWWQEVVLILVSLGDPSLFTPFMRELLKRPELVGASDTLLEMLLEEAAEVSPAPFVEMLREPPTRDHARWAGQLVALRLLERLGATAAMEAVAPLLQQHPSPEIRAWLAARGAAAAGVVSGNVIVTERGGVELVHIRGGSVLMGSPREETGRFKDEGPQHEAVVPSFWMGRYPVTNEEYARFLRDNPSSPEPEYWSERRLNGARQPVVGVSWHEAQRFSEWAGGRLPSEAEWEYAARAGSQLRYVIGSTEADLARIAWYAANADGTTHAVGGKEPNAWGLRDVLGNVWEWVEDVYVNTYEGAPADGSARTMGGASRVVRGGSFFNDPQYARVAGRSWVEPSYRDVNLGFRLARS